MSARQNIAEVLANLGAAKSRRELWEMQLDHLDARGVKMICYHVPFANGALHGIAMHGFPEEWVEKYRAEGFEKINPGPALAIQLARPFYWHEIEHLAPKSKATTEYLTAAKAAKLGDGLAFHVYGPKLMNAYVGFGFGKNHINLTKTEEFELQCIAQSGHTRYCELTPRDQTPASVLTPREHEILELVANGKSNSVIAQILDMSKHTVDSHMRSIYKKLDVSDRTTAAIKGVGNGFIPLT